MPKPRNYITEHVYLDPQDVSPKLMAWMKAELRFPDPEGEMVQAFMHDEETDKIVLPRGPLLVQGLDWPEMKDRTVSRPCPSFPDALKKPRPYQVLPIKKLKIRGGGVLHAPTGSGKTVLFLMLFAKLKQRALVIVHTKDLFNQWLVRAEEHLGIPRDEIGQWGSGKSTVGEHLTIAMVQSLRRLPLAGSEWAEQFGVVLLDECHRAPADTFATVLQSFPARHLYGATATKTRPDGMHPLMHAILGPTISTIPQDKLVADGSLILPEVRLTRTEFSSVAGARIARSRNSHQAKNLYMRVTQDLIADEKRNDLIADTVMKLHAEKPRFGLILSERIEHLETIHRKMIERDWEVSAHILTGKHDAVYREELVQMMRDKGINWILATQLANEGLDIDVLDTLVLTFPRKSVEPLQQQIGRAMRSAPGKTDALVIDFVDVGVPTLLRHAKTRHQWYQRQGLKVSKGSWSPGPEVVPGTKRKGPGVASQLNQLDLLEGVALEGMRRAGVKKVAVGSQTYDTDPKKRRGKKRR